MKRFLIILMLAWGAVGTAVSQPANANCNGLRNPVNFNLYPAYSGATGIKTAVAANAVTGELGMSFTNNLTCSQLATYTQSGSAHYCGSSLDIHHPFRIMSTTEGPGTGNNLGKDPLTNYNLPYAPAGFQHSIRIGTCEYQKFAEALYYNMKVTPQNSILYLYFAPCIQIPPNFHGPAADPSFIIRVTRKPLGSTGNFQANAIQHDTSCYVIASSGVTNGTNGWYTYPTSGNVEKCGYRNWERVCLNLYPYLYDSIRVEVMIADCEWNGHYGYCYFMGDCREATIQVLGCNSGASDTVAIASVPGGMNAYQWYRSKNGGRTQSTDLANDFVMIPGATDSVLAVHQSDFIGTTTGDTAGEQTFVCKLTTYMDPVKPLWSTMRCYVSNMKPILRVDSTLQCDMTVQLTDISEVVSDGGNEANRVDHDKCQWYFYNASMPVGDPVFVDTGSSTSWQYAEPGMHSVVMRTYTGNQEKICFTEDTIRIRALAPVHPAIQLSDQDICAGDTVYIYDRTPGSTYHHWVLSREGRVVLDTIMPTASLPRWAYDSTTTVTLYSHTAEYTLRDTNNDGIMDRVYCIGRSDTVLRVHRQPVLNITGETVVCKGQLTNATARSDQAGCTFSWYEVMNGNTAVSNSTTLAVELAGDKQYYLKGVSPYGCESWDSVTLMLVDPVLKCSTDRICTGDTVRLWGSKAATFEWSSNPTDDASFWGQENNDTIVVMPLHTTTYTMVGKGSNGCGATELRQKITVYDYPIPSVQLTPGYIDSEHPSVQFTDMSPNGTISQWNFGDGTTSTSRSIVHNFSSINADSVLISLQACNPLHCCNDTQFYVPVGIFSVWYPNVFTPRLETNSTFHAYTKNRLVDYEIYIYDRMGNLVFHSVDPLEGWDGSYKGSPLPQGAYVYIATYKRDDGSTRTMSQKGTVTLLR